VILVSVVVEGSDDVEGLESVLRSVDAQTVPASAVELVVVLDGAAEEVRRRWERLRDRRPHLVLAEGGDPGGLAAASGEFVLRVRPGDSLYPEALARLLAQADGLDAVAGRVVAPRTATPALLTRDRDLLDADDAAAALTSPCLLVRRDLVPSDAGAGPAGAVRVGVLASYPTLRRRAEPAAAPPVTLLDQRRSLTWAGPHLRLEAEGTLEGLPLGVAPADLTLVARLREVDTRLTHLLEGTGTVVATSSEGSLTWTLTAQLDPRAAAPGTPLETGVWEFEASVAGSDGVGAVRRLGWAPSPAGVVEGLVVVPAPAGRTLRLDVGTTRWPLVSAADVAGATVTESATGSLLVLPLPDVHVAGEAVLPAEVGLGSLPVPARLVLDGRGATVEALVSGLPGVVRLGVGVAGGPLRPSGLQLRIGQDGAMAVEPVPAPKAPAPAPAPAAAPSAAPAPAARSRRSAPAAPLSRVQHLRRALPAPLEPVADALARQQVVRRLYRRLARL